MLTRLIEFVLEKLLGAVGEKLRDRFGPPALTVELPPPVNPIGLISAGGSRIPHWSVKLRFLVRPGNPRDILELHLDEEGVGRWHVDEIFKEDTGRAVPWPIHVQTTEEVWIRTRSARSF